MKEEEPLAPDRLSGSGQTVMGAVARRGLLLFAVAAALVELPGPVAAERMRRLSVLLPSP